MANSGDLRGMGALARPDTASVSRTVSEMNFCMRGLPIWGFSFITFRAFTAAEGGCAPQSSYQHLTDLFPFVSYALHFCCGRGCGIFCALFAFEHPRHHSGNNGSVENL